MRPEYRNDIDLKYKRKIEMIVRKPDKTEEEVRNMGDILQTNMWIISWKTYDNLEFSLSQHKFCWNGSPKLFGQVASLLSYSFADMTQGGLVFNFCLRI